MANPVVQGNLPFGTMAGGGSDYGTAYNSALAMNAANYRNVLAGYQQVLAQQGSANDAISQGYTQLAGQVQQSLAGAEQGQRMDIQDAATRATASNQQDLISRGLGNSTIQATLSRGVEADKARAVNNLVGQMAGLRASYASQLGQASLAQRAAANQQYAALAKQQLDFMNSVNSPYPDAGKYAELAKQWGAARQAAANRFGGMGGGFQPEGGGGGMPPRRPMQQQRQPQQQQVQQPAAVQQARMGQPGGGGPAPGQPAVQPAPAAGGGIAVPPRINLGPTNAGVGGYPSSVNLGPTNAGVGGYPATTPGISGMGMDPSSCPGGDCGSAGAMSPAADGSTPGYWDGGYGPMPDMGSGGYGDPSGYDYGSMPPAASSAAWSPSLSDSLYGGGVQLGPTNAGVGGYPSYGDIPSAGYADYGSGGGGDYGDY